jgi:hypothetical protein
LSTCMDSGTSFPLLRASVKALKDQEEPLFAFAAWLDAPDTAAAEARLSKLWNLASVSRCEAARGLFSEDCAVVHTPDAMVQRASAHDTIAAWDRFVDAVLEPGVVSQLVKNGKRLYVGTRLLQALDAGSKRLHDIAAEAIDAMQLRNDSSATAAIVESGVAIWRTFVSIGENPSCCNQAQNKEQTQEQTREQDQGCDIPANVCAVFHATSQVASLIQSGGIALDSLVIQAASGWVILQGDAASANALLAQHNASENGRISSDVALQWARTLTLTSQHEEAAQVLEQHMLEFGPAALRCELFQVTQKESPALYYMWVDYCDRLVADIGLSHDKMHLLKAESSKIRLNRPVHSSAKTPVWAQDATSAVNELLLFLRFALEKQVLSKGEKANPATELRVADVLQREAGAVSALVTALMDLGRPKDAAGISWLVAQSLVNTRYNVLPHFLCKTANALHMLLPADTDLRKAVLTSCAQASLPRARDIMNQVDVWFEDTDTNPQHF